jgi:hypothetical protein
MLKFSACLEYKAEQKQTRLGNVIELKILINFRN